MTTLLQFLAVLLGVFVLSSVSTFIVSFVRIRCGHEEKKVWDKDFKPTFLAFFIPQIVLLITVFLI